MNAEDMQHQFKEPGKAVLALQEYCQQHGLSYELMNGAICIHVPKERATPAALEAVAASFLNDEIELLDADGNFLDAQGWPTSAIDESRHDPDTPLTEGEPPQAL